MMQEPFPSFIIFSMNSSNSYWIIFDKFALFNGDDIQDATYQMSKPVALTLN